MPFDSGILSALEVQNDARAEELGIHTIAVRYHDHCLITPKPNIFDHGVKQLSEWTNALSDAESFHIWELQLLRRPFPAQLEAAKPLAIAAGMAQADVDRVYTVAAATRNNAPWHVSNDDGVTWRQVRIGTDAIHDPMFWKILFISRGV
jgi:hypothetical protein